MLNARKNVRLGALLFSGLMVGCGNDAVNSDRPCSDFGPHEKKPDRCGVDPRTLPEGGKVTLEKLNFNGDWAANLFATFIGASYPALMPLPGDPCFKFFTVTLPSNPMVTPEPQVFYIDAGSTVTLSSPGAQTLTLDRSDSGQGYDQNGFNYFYAYMPAAGGGLSPVTVGFGTPGDDGLWPDGATYSINIAGSADYTAQVIDDMLYLPHTGTVTVNAYGNPALAAQTLDPADLAGTPTGNPSAMIVRPNQDFTFSWINNGETQSNLLFFVLFVDFANPINATICLSPTGNSGGPMTVSAADVGLAGAGISDSGIAVFARVSHRMYPDEHGRRLDVVGFNCLYKPYSKQ